MTRYLLFFLVASAAVGADLEVTRVALYKHGVAFFERAGDLAAGESARLEFKASEMDDVLKSLTIRQEGGDGVSAVQYDSADPLEKRLENFSFRVGEGASMATVLDQFKGARIAVKTDVSAVEGLIVSARSFAAGEDGERQELLLASEGGGLRSLDPRGAQELRFLDEELQQRFLSNMQSDQLRYYVNNPEYDETARRKLEEIAKRLDAYAALEAREIQLEDQLEKVEDAQDRLRQNIGTLDGLAGQGERVQQMADQLSANEDRISALEAEIEAVEEQLENSEEEIEQALEKLAF